VKGKVILTDGFGKAPARLKAWRKNIWATSSGYIHDAYPSGWFLEKQGVYDVYLQFFLPKPKTVKRTHPNVRCGDIDKLCRAVLDALTASVFADDSQVCRLTATKEYATGGQKPGVKVTIIARENVAEGGWLCGGFFEGPEG
jgi:Holliday junction resolvase RusA-like endonuclease